MDTEDYIRRHLEASMKRGKIICLLYCHLLLLVCVIRLHIILFVFNNARILHFFWVETYVSASRYPSRPQHVSEGSVKFHGRRSRSRSPVNMKAEHSRYRRSRSRSMSPSNSSRKRLRSRRRSRSPSWRTSTSRSERTSRTEDDGRHANRLESRRNIERDDKNYDCKNKVLLSTFLSSGLNDQQVSP